MKFGNALAHTDKKGMNQTTQHIIIAMVIMAMVAIVSLLFFFSMLSHYHTTTTPTILDAAQIGATNHSVLISWSCTHQAEQYHITCTDEQDNPLDSFTTNIPFAKIDNLEPNATCRVEISATVDGVETKPVSLTCATDYFCAVQNVQVNKITSDSADISWEYSGTNSGFVAIAYVTDMEGKRHLTSQKVEVSQKEECHCIINGLIPEMHYTVAVMPMTNYFQIGKAQFQTTRYRTRITKPNVVRCVICPNDSDDAPHVKSLKSITADTPYKLSLILNGKTTAEDTSQIDLFIKDSSGHLISETNFSDVSTNPENKLAHVYRIFLLDFQSPSAQGAYTLTLTIDGQLGANIKFTVEK